MNHTIEELRQKQSMPLEAKIIMSQRRIKEWYDFWDGDVYVAFSGGKDSTVLKHLVEHTPGVYDVPSVYANTGLEYPEIQKFARSQENVEVIYPKKKYPEIFKEYGYPVVSKEVSDAVYEVQHNYGKKTAIKRFNQLMGIDINPNTGEKSHYNKEKWRFLIDSDFRISNRCCNFMKKLPFHTYDRQTNRKGMIGTLAEESRLRESAWLKTGCNAFQNGKSTPMAFWNENDVLEYIVRFNVPYCKEIYGEIIETDPGHYITTKAKRTGCMFCMFGAHLEDQPNRFQQMAKTHPHQYDFCLRGGEYDSEGKWIPNSKGLGLAHVLDFLDIPYERLPELFDDIEE